MKKAGSFIGDAAAFCAGCAMFGASVNIFIAPGGITMGGFTGIATTLQSILGTPVGLFIFLLNLPLLALEIKTGRGTGGLWRSVCGIVGTSAATDIMAFFPYAYSDRLLCALLGGLLMGAGSGLLMTRGFTTGGSDLAAYLIRRKSRRLTTGRLILIIDTTIIISSALVMKNLSGILFSFAAVWCYTTAFDRMLEGIGGAVLALIISEKHSEIAGAVAMELSRGVTVMSSSGWYTGRDRPTLMCVVRKSELFALRSLVEGVDGGAFVIIVGASEVLGEGFAAK